MRFDISNGYADLDADYDREHRYPDEWHTS